MAVSLYSDHVARWKGCTACSLHERRSRVVLYRGKVPCDVLFIGEAPGDSEDAVGVPFIGPAGKELDAWIEKAFGRLTFCPVCRKSGRFEKQYGAEHLVVDEIFTCGQGHDGEPEGAPIRVGFTNLVACIPKGEDGQKVAEPEDESIKACSGRLQELVRIAKPKMIVQVGRLAQTWLTVGMKTTIKLDPVRFVKITHPAAVLRARIDQKGFLQQQAIVTLRNMIDEINDPLEAAPPPKGKTVKYSPSKVPTHPRESEIPY